MTIVFQKNKSKQSESNKLSKEILDWLHYSYKKYNVLAFRVNTTGVPRIKYGKFGQKEIQFSKAHKEGVSDIYCLIVGVSIWIEVKTGKDVLSPSQKQFRDETRNAGGLYIVARNIEDVIEIVCALPLPTKYYPTVHNFHVIIHELNLQNQAKYPK